MSPTKVKAQGIIRNENLAGISVLSAPDRCGLAYEVLQVLGDRGINVEFIVACIDTVLKSHIVLCVRREDLDAALTALRPIQDQLEAESIVGQQNVALVSVFGPDFRSRPGIAVLVFEGLASAGINVLAIGTSISTVSCLVDGSRVGDAEAALKKHFELP
jgi:aspartate kinase